MPVSGTTVRKITAPCGFQCKGSVRESDGKFRIHKKRCPICQAFGNAPEFDKEQAKKNGYNGIKRSKYGNLIQTVPEKKIVKCNPIIMEEIE